MLFKKRLKVKPKQWQLKNHQEGLNDNQLEMKAAFIANASLCLEPDLFE